MSRDFIFHRKRDKLTFCGFRRILVPLESLGIAGHSVPRESQLICEESLAFLNSGYSQMKKTKSKSERLSGLTIFNSDLWHVCSR